MCLGTWWAWEGVVAFQSLSTVIKGTSPFNFQPKEPFSKFIWQQTEWYEVWGGGIHPPIALNLKNGSKTSDYQSNGPPSKLHFSKKKSCYVRKWMCVVSLIYICWYLFLKFLISFWFLKVIKVNVWNQERKGCNKWKINSNRRENEDFVSQQQNMKTKNKQIFGQGPPPSRPQCS